MILAKNMMPHNGADECRGGRMTTQHSCAALDPTLGSAD
jgi:hypothetical protein